MKNAILKGITGLAVVTFFTAGSFIETLSIIPVIVLFGSLGWLLLFSIANYEEVRRDSRYEK